MDYCCSERGSAVGPLDGSIGLVPDCYFWCELVFNGQGDIDQQFENARNAFTQCLTTGVNASRSLGGMACSKGPANIAGDNGGSMMNDTNAMNNTNGTSNDAPSDESSGAAPSRHSNTKLAGLVGGLLVAGMIVGVV